MVGPTVALAQRAPVVARPVVQAVPDGNRNKLDIALARLGRDPRDVAALIDAGDAARGLGDFDAAIGFYRRADEIFPNNARVKEGMARAYVMKGDPVSALPYFDAAQNAGATPSLIAGDRGLAYDLVGDNVTAQRYYAIALGAAESDDVRMRYALSQAMSGDQKSAEATLMPLLRKQDKPAWRTRAFALAIGGDTKQAVDVVNTILPPQLAENIAPYLRYMPRLTRAQQAAAANLGQFPRASEIGHDDPRIAAYSPARLAAADSALVPRGEALDAKGGKNAKAVKAANTQSSKTAAKLAAAETSRSEAVRKMALASGDPDRVAPPEPKPAIESGGELPPIRQSAEASSAVTAASAPRIVAAPRTEPSPVQQMPSAPARAEVKAPVKAPAPGFDLSRLPATQAGTSVSSASMPATRPSPGFVSQGMAPPPKPPAAANPPPTAPDRPSLAEIFADFGKPTTKAVPTSGAVDIRQITPTRPEAKPDPKAEAKAAEKAKPKKPAPPAHPSRIWVQIGVGRDKDAIAFDWRRHVKQASAVFKGREPYVSEMGRTNRVLVGPFETQKAANQFLAELKKAGFDDALPWTSPAGQVVDPLSVK